MVILNYLSWICDDMRLGLGHKKKDEQGWNARSYGMEKTSTKMLSWDRLREVSKTKIWVL